MDVALPILAVDLVNFLLCDVMGNVIQQFHPYGLPLTIKHVLEDLSGLVGE